MASKSEQSWALLALFLLGLSCVMFWRYTQDAKYMHEVHWAESEAAQARAARNAAEAKATKQVNEMHLAESEAAAARAAQSAAETKANEEVHSAESETAAARAAQNAAETKANDEVHSADSEAIEARHEQKAAEKAAAAKVRAEQEAASAKAKATQQVRAADSRAAKAQADIGAAQSAHQSANDDSMQLIFLMGMLTALVLAEIVRRPEVVALKERVSGKVARVHDSLSGEVSEKFYFIDRNSGKVGRVNDKRQPLLSVDGPIVGA